MGPLGNGRRRKTNGLHRLEPLLTDQNELEVLAGAISWGFKSPSPHPILKDLHVGFEVWMAIGEKDRRPVSEIPRLRVVRFSKQSLDFGQTTHDVEGVPLRVFSVAKTVADC